ncbi:MAG: hydroxymethylglutaryl-CoA reductase [Bacteroidales bacterium]|nr:hydroxymethylglutaryl-CoA reductase [Bacteroidales bacterium]
MATRERIKKGFSKLLKEEKLKLIANYFENPGEVVNLLKSYWHSDSKQQQLFDEFSENTITNFFIPYGISPNVTINGKDYIVPMVIEESSVVAAASAAAKFWGERGGFHAEVIDVRKVGQVHFGWSGDKEKLFASFPEIEKRLLADTDTMTEKMRKRGGGILGMRLIDYSDQIPDYYQIRVEFGTGDAMGANFINSVLEQFGHSLQDFFAERNDLPTDLRKVEIIMTILSNNTPDCRVRVWVECPVEQLDGIDETLSGADFAKKFKKAVDIAHIDVDRATTHNKGIYNGIDAVVIATGNDFRAVEAAGHTFASRNGRYESLSSATIGNGIFHFELEVPMALGTVGGLTSLHPLAKKTLELLGNPTAPELMMVAASMGLANNFSAVRSLTTKGIQAGHMKMHLNNILNQLNANEEEKKKAREYFKDKTVSYAGVEQYLDSLKK